MEVHIKNGIIGLEYAIRNARTDLEEQQNKICKTEHEEQEKETSYEKNNKNYNKLSLVIRNISLWE